MTTVVVVTSPLQIWHAILYLRHVGVATADCVVLHVESVSEKSNTQARAALAAEPWGQIHVLDQYPPGPAADGDSPAEREYLARGAYMASLSEILSPLVVRRVVLGDYRPLSFRQVLRFAEPGAEIVLVDDGAGTRNILKYRGNPAAWHLDLAEIVRGRPLNAIEGGDKYADPFTYPDPGRLVFFSIYTAELSTDDTLISNTYYERALNGVDVRKLDEAWFVGAVHLELGMTRLKPYVRLLAALKQAAGDRPLVYLPHRREDPAKLDLIRNDLGLEVRDLRRPLEEHMVETGEVPWRLLSVGSMVVDTASRMLAGIAPVTVVIPPPAYFGPGKAAHLRRSIIQCVLENTNVEAVPSDPESLRARFVLERVSAPHRMTARPAMDGLDVEAGALDGLTGDEPEATGERLLRETGTRGLHRVTFPPITGGARLVLRLTPLGREHFRLRLVDPVDKSTVDADFQSDKPAAVELDDGVRHFRLGSGRQADGFVHVRGLLVNRPDLATMVQLLALKGGPSRVSRHAGDPALGFALASSPPAESPVVELNPGERDVHLLQFDLLDPTFAEFSIAIGTWTGTLLFADLDESRVVELRKSPDFKNTSFIRVPAGGTRFRPCTPVQLVAFDGRISVRPRKQDWKEIRSGAGPRDPIRISASDIHGGTSTLRFVDAGPRTAADDLWLTELSRSATP